jgi:2-polyprenyl-6-methoxyphenol hydroxylase-like FAD-dependent oxidoreductase
MSDVLVLGAGLNGLCTAMLLARDGHRVTVLERDAAEPTDPASAWEEWSRQGCNQFRLPHYILPRWRHLAERELPDVAAAVDAAGGARFDPIAALPDSVTGGRQPDDDRFTTLTARRPVLEAAVGQVVAAQPGITIRRGTGVRALLTGPGDGAGIPHVVGVVTAAGEQIAADVVVDVSGRRSALPSWLAAIGAAPPAEELEDSGFVYYGRHFRGVGGMPAMRASLQQHYDSVGLLTLPADNGTWSVTFTAASSDTTLRALRETPRWEAAVRCYPLVAHWADAEPLGGVAVMAAIEDRIRHLVVDGSPVVTGVLTLGDAWACTNPSLGRGASMGLMHAVLLRDVLRKTGPESPHDLALHWDEATRRELEPWYRATLTYDRHRLAEIEADRTGVAYAGNQQWSTTKAMAASGGSDPEVLRAGIDIASMLTLPPEVLQRPGMLDRISSAGGGAPQYPLPGPDRRGLEAALAAA